MYLHICVCEQINTWWENVYIIIRISLTNSQLHIINNNIWILELSWFVKITKCILRIRISYLLTLMRILKISLAMYQWLPWICIMIHGTINEISQLVSLVIRMTDLLSCRDMRLPNRSTVKYAFCIVSYKVFQAFSSKTEGCTKSRNKIFRYSAFHNLYY